MTRVIVCGSRDYSDAQSMFKVLGGMNISTPFDLLMHGGAKGADVMAGDWACCFGIPVKRFEARWHELGRAAGPIRNAEMISEGRPDFVICFPSGLLKDSKGTRDMAAKAVNARVPVWVVHDGVIGRYDGITVHPLEYS